MPEQIQPVVRSRRARSSLTVDEILAAAEHVAAEGFEALTIRAVATELQSSPMALYRYFATKDDLVDALLNTVLGRFAPPAQTDNWVDDLRAFAHSHRELLARHPWALAPLMRSPFPGRNALPIGEAALRILRRGGITGTEAVATFSGIIALNYGWSSFVLGRADEEPGVVPALPEPDFPLTAEVADELSRYGSAEHYEFTLTQLLAGLNAAAQGSSGRHVTAG
jgi:AcrR family transcriptional regulator